jgi:hypothetical protein
MAVRTWAQCEACGKRFRLDPYNADRQRYCTAPKCVLARKRRRQREWYARKCREDLSFAQAARRRCAGANRRRRARKAEEGRAPPAPPLLESTPEVLSEVVLGLLCQLTDSTDRSELSATMRSCRERGRRVAALVPSTTSTG